ncbi:unnamed protein product, partial [Ectocarpus sp. 12 AP-2014]
EAGGGSYSKGEGDAIEVLDAPAAASAAAAAAAAAASEEDEEERADSVSSEATSLSSSPEDMDGDGGGGSPRSCFSLSTAATSDRLPPGMRLGPASRVIHGKPPAAAAAVAAPASATAVATLVPSTPHIIKPGGMHSSVSGSNGARQQKSTGANLFEFAASIMRGNSSSGGGGPGRGWGGGGRGAAGWSDVRGGGPGGKGGGSTSASGVRGGGENMATPGWFDQTPFSTPGGGGGGVHYPAHSATAQGALAETVELALGRGRTTTASRGQGAGGLFDNRGEGGGAATGNGMEGYLDIRSARQAMILANTFFKTEKGGGSANEGEGGGVDSKGGGGRQGRTYLLRELRDHPLWKHPRFWHEALMLGVKEQLQEGPANASRWDDLHGEARREAVARTHNVVFSQLASIAFNMLECGVDGARVRSDVTRKCRESQLGEAQVQDLLRDLDRRIRLSDGDPADEGLQAYSLTSPASDGKNPPRTGTSRPATSAVGVSSAASGVVPSGSSTKTKKAFAAGTPAAYSTTANVPARARSRSAAAVGESNTTAVAVAAASGRKFAASDEALAGRGGSVVVDLPRAVPVDISPLNAAAAAAAASGGLHGDSPAGHFEQGLPNVVSELIRVCVSDKDEYREDAWRAVVRLALAGAENDDSRTRESSSNEISPPPPSKAASTGGGASSGPPGGVTSGPVARAAAADGEERQIIPATEGLPSERTALAPSLSGRLAAAFSRSLAKATGDAPGDAAPASAVGERVSQDAAAAAAAAVNNPSVGGPAHQSAVRVLFPTADGSSISSSAMEALSPGGDASGTRERAGTSVSQAAFTAGTRERAGTSVSQAAVTAGTRERARTAVSQAAVTAGTRERAGTSVSQAAATVTAVTRERAGTSVSQAAVTAVTRERADTSVSQAAATAEMTNDEEYDML